MRILNARQSAANLRCTVLTCTVVEIACCTTTDQRRSATVVTDHAPPLRAEFFISAARFAQCPNDDEPEVAFVGRSNAGKSSVLNRLAGKHALARVSRTPGRTQLINMFTVLSGGRLVDLPGYGYAAAPHAVRERWQDELDQYLNARNNLTGLVLVADVRHPLKPLDLALARWSGEAVLPLLLLLNKSDKLKHGARQNALLMAQRTVGEYPLVQVQLFSAHDALGLDEATVVVCGWLKKSPPDAPPESTDEHDDRA